MATRNDVTGDELKSRGNTEAYQNGYDRIWGKKKHDEQAVGQGVPGSQEVGGTGAEQVQHEETDS